MTAPKDPQQFQQELLAILNNTLDEGPWDSSLFLQSTSRELRKIRDEVANELQHKHSIVTKTAKHLLRESAKRPDGESIFIYLYAQDGHKLEHWQQVLSHLTEQAVTRPIYAKEADVIARIRALDDKPNMAYVEVVVETSDILEQQADLADPFGHALLSVRPGAVKMQNIIRLVHRSGEYRFIEGRLKARSL